VTIQSLKSTSHAIAGLGGASYTYLATDLITGSILGELPVNSVSLDCQLNKAGNMHCGANLNDPRIDNNEFIARTTPGRTAFWAYRNNQIVWGGIILSREYQSTGMALTLTGQTFECYAVRRFPRSVLGTAIQTLNQGQASIVDYLWKQLQSVPGGNIGVQPANLPASDPVVQLTINGYDLSTSYDDLIQSILVSSTGPDYTIAWYEDGHGNPQKQLVAATPIGNPVGITDLVVDFPGSMVDYIYSENASSGANKWWAVGDGEAAAATVGTAADPNSVASGYPLWEGVNNYSGVTIQTTINGHASSDVKSLPVPIITHNADLAGDSYPQFGTYGMGDYVTAHVIDPRFPQGSTFNVRAIGWTITPPDSGQGVEQIALVFDEATGGPA
jgi:hypothetical protein